ncbi:DNA cytosine methyltransferase [Vibrio sp. THAF190c]|nr:DNA cytosine methyltransferase [Vibrio sp. THAF190c]
MRTYIAGFTFDEGYIWPKLAVPTKAMIGNAVPPEMARRVTEAVLKAA